MVTERELSDTLRGEVEELKMAVQALRGEMEELQSLEDTAEDEIVEEQVAGPFWAKLLTEGHLNTFSWAEIEWDADTNAWQTKPDGQTGSTNARSHLNFAKYDDEQPVLMWVEVDDADDLQYIFVPVQCNPGADDTYYVNTGVAPTSGAGSSAQGTTWTRGGDTKGCIMWNLSRVEYNTTDKAFHGFYTKTYVDAAGYIEKVLEEVKYVITPTTDCP